MYNTFHHQTFICNESQSQKLLKNYTKILSEVIKAAKKIHFDKLLGNSFKKQSKHYVEPYHK
jgi:hypothetical protein